MLLVGAMFKKLPVTYECKKKENLNMNLGKSSAEMMTLLYSLFQVSKLI